MIISIPEKFNQQGRYMVALQAMMTAQAKLKRPFYFAEDVLTMDGEVHVFLDSWNGGGVDGPRSTVVSFTPDDCKEDAFMAVFRAVGGAHDKVRGPIELKNYKVRSDGTVDIYIESPCRTMWPN